MDTPVATVGLAPVGGLEIKPGITGLDEEPGVCDTTGLFVEAACVDWDEVGRAVIQLKTLGVLVVTPGMGVVLEAGVDVEAPVRMFDQGMVEPGRVTLDCTAGVAVDVDRPTGNGGIRSPGTTFD